MMYVFDLLEGVWMKYGVDMDLKEYDRPVPQIAHTSFNIKIYCDCEWMI